MSGKRWRVLWLYLAAGCPIIAAAAAIAAKERDWVAACLCVALVAGEIALLACRRRVEAWVEDGKGGEQ